MLAKIHTFTVIGISGIPLEIEVDIANGLPAFDIIGLPDASVREAKERVRAAVRNSGLSFPNSRITVNLAPADLKKEGSAFDLAIAVGLLTATGQIKVSDSLCAGIFVGELSLDGKVRGITGTLAIALSISQSGNASEKVLFLPAENAPEAALVDNLESRGVDNLSQLVRHLNGEEPLAPSIPFSDNPEAESRLETDADFKDVCGQETAKRALEIAAAGAHNVLLYGPPGSGKTMLARRIPSILPNPSKEEILEITRIHSVAGLISSSYPLKRKRPFRSPHHSASTAGIIGGGRNPKPGEVSLAHLGILFFDELPEYRREVLEALRQPLEDHTVTVTRVSGSVTYPADFMFIGSMNPCPCGHFGDPRLECRCSPNEIYRYRSKLSGPLIDRIDIQVEVPAIKYEHLKQKYDNESSAEIQDRVNQARDRQQFRYRDFKIFANGQLQARLFERYCPLDSEARALLHQAFHSLKMSMRAHDRIIKVARTIADLANQEVIEASHIAEAVQYRSLDRQI